LESSVQAVLCALCRNRKIIIIIIKVHEAYGAGLHRVNGV